VQLLMLMLHLKVQLTHQVLLQQKQLQLVSQLKQNI
jgi:hypothetical protein